MKIGKLIDPTSFLLVFFWVVAALAQSAALSDNEELNKLIAQGGVLRAKPGYAASGVVIAQTGNALYLDSTPCLTVESKRIVAFAKPYTESNVSDAVCNGKHYSQIQVIQE